MIIVGTLVDNVFARNG